jgi:hypothetical protein
MREFGTSTEMADFVKMTLRKIMKKVQIGGTLIR